MIDFVFAFCAITSVVCAVLIVSRRNPVYSVVFMLPFFLAMTALFVLLSAVFLAAIQMIVYGGAILVVFLFVLMLINLRPEELRDDFSWWSYGASTLGVVLLAAIMAQFVRRGVSPELEEAFQRELPVEKAFGSVESLARPLFSQNLMAFELVSILIIVAILGAVLLAKKKV